MAADYYVDFDNGHDVNNDGTSHTKTNGDGPWATLDKATATLAAGEVCAVRRGMTQAVSADLTFTNDGTILAPITLEADFDDYWSDEVDLSGTETATLIFGSKVVTFTGDISGVLAANDWIYASGDDNRKFAYEVASISGGSNEIATLFLPYKGNQAGAGVTMYNMQDNPIWNTAAGDYEVNLDSDNYWKFQGLHFRGTDTSGVLEIDSIIYVELHDMIFEGNGASDKGIQAGAFGADGIAGVLSKCRFYNYLYGVYAGRLGGLTFRDNLFDGNSVASSIGLRTQRDYPPRCVDSEFKNHAFGDLSGTSTPGGAPHNAYLRNCLLSSATEFDIFDSAVSAMTVSYMEDKDQVENISMQNWALDLIAAGTIAIQSDTVDVRGGGGATSIKVTPMTNLDTELEVARIKLFEFPIYAVKDVAKTYTAYLKSDDDTDWDADPLNTELWIEAEYWNHATNPARVILKSTEVCNNFDADDTVWDTLTVTCTPLQTGVLYLRGYYRKPKEGGKSNIFFCDTLVEIT